MIAILTESYPSNFWFIPAVVLCILGATAWVDGRTGRVPDLPLLIGTILALAFFAWGEGMVAAGGRVIIIGVTVFALWFVNFIYYRRSGRDGLGFGDAKWSGLAVSVFPVTAVIWAWLIASLTALLWLAVRRRQIPFSQQSLYLAPFLFFGLVVALVWRGFEIIGF